jgi:hypothetical protein
VSTITARPHTPLKVDPCLCMTHIIVFCFCKHFHQLTLKPDSAINHKSRRITYWVKWGHFSSNETMLSVAKNKAVTATAAAAKSTGFAMTMVTMVTVSVTHNLDKCHKLH